MARERKTFDRRYQGVADNVSSEGYATGSRRDAPRTDHRFFSFLRRGCHRAIASALNQLGDSEEGLGVVSRDDELTKGLSLESVREKRSLCLRQVSIEGCGSWKCVF